MSHPPAYRIMIVEDDNHVAHVGIRNRTERESLSTAVVFSLKAEHHRNRQELLEAGKGSIVDGTLP